MSFIISFLFFEVCDMAHQITPKKYLYRSIGSPVSRTQLNNASIVVCDSACAHELLPGVKATASETSRVPLGPDGLPTASTSHS